MSFRTLRSKISQNGRPLGRKPAPEVVEVAESDLIEAESVAEWTEIEALGLILAETAAELRFSVAEGAHDGLLEALLDAELAGKARKTVIKTIEDRIIYLKGV